MSVFPHPQSTYPGIFWAMTPCFMGPGLSSPYAGPPYAWPTIPPLQPSSPLGTSPPDARPHTQVPPAASRPPNGTSPTHIIPAPSGPPAGHTAPEQTPIRSLETAIAPVADLPWIDPLIAFSPSPGASPPFAWDLADDPTLLLAGRPSVRQDPAVRSGASATAPAMRTITLLFPHLPPVEITVLPTYPREFATPADVLVALHRALREPVPAHVLAQLGRDQQAQLRRDARARCVASGEAADGVVKKIDFLAGRRRFLGLRPARQVEVPFGKDPGQVFLVEHGLVEG